jgi:hypothetical protein
MVASSIPQNLCPKMERLSFICEWAATKKIKGDSPLFYTLIILALKKMKDGKKGTVPFYFLFF